MEAFPAIMLLMQQPKVAAYRMVEKEEHKRERIPGLPAFARVEVAAALVVLMATAALVVLMATAALAALAKCISVFTFKEGNDELLHCK